MDFVDRDQELARLGYWWDEARGGSLGIVWGRRRVGKTELIRTFATGRRALFHIGARRPVTDELRILAGEAAAILGTDSMRDLRRRPYADWTDAIESLCEAASARPMLVVLDEFPELVEVCPELPSILRAVWDRLRHRTHLRLLLCGSAVRTMEAMQEEREPLYGRFDLALTLHPFRPHEAALMLRDLPPAERARVWGITGGVPQYLAWWDPGQSLPENLERLACTPGGHLLAEGDLVMATEGGSGDLSSQILYAIAAGRTKFSEIKDAVRTDPTRGLERLRSLRLIDRILPVTEDEHSTRRRCYRIADNFLAFWLGVLSKHRGQIDFGLGSSLLPVLLQELDDHMGPRWEEAFRQHLRLLAEQGRLGEEVVAIGPFWSSRDRGAEAEIDAVVLAGRERSASLAGEAKWSREVDGRRLLLALLRKVEALPRARADLRLAIASREAIAGVETLRDVTGGEVLAFTAADVFGEA
ncbi:MAG: ATP-binding protein [Candidatus Sericytochromatia bacterium]|nr:ATP-binding protein [Candidatus Tanganyikabacteria bacterium]